MDNNEKSKITEERIKAMTDSKQIPAELEPENIAELLRKKGEEKRRRSISQRAIKTAAVCVAAVALVVCASKLTEYITEPHFNNHSFEKSTTYDDVYAQLSSAYYVPKKDSGFADFFADIFGGFNTKNEDMDSIELYKDEAMPESNKTTITNGNESGNRYSAESESVNQVEGIDEADIIKSDGKNIYYVTMTGLYSVPVSSGSFGEVKMLMKLAEESNQVQELFLCDDRLVLVRCNHADFVEPVDGVIKAKGTTKITVLSLSGETLGEYSQNGTFGGVRMKDDILYLVTINSDFSKNNVDPDRHSTFIPAYCDSQGTHLVEPQNISIPETIQSYAYTVAGSYDINAPESGKSIVASAGKMSAMYMSDTAIYVATLCPSDNGAKTAFTKILCDNGTLKIDSSAELKGNILNQFSMDEYDGCLRVALTFVRDGISESGVYTLDKNMKLLGSLEGLGKTEQIKSVRFSEKLAYVVTFRQTDPLYAIDLSDPAKPALTDELKITGYGTYMHNWSDDLLLSLGVEANEAGFGQGMKLAMYRRSDNGELTQEGYMSFLNTDESWNDSVAIYERKAFFIDRSRGIIGLPMNTQSLSNNGSSEERVSKYLVLSYENGGFINRGTIKMPSELCGGFDRAVCIGDYLYVASPLAIVAYDLSSNAVVSQTSLPLS